MKAEAASAGGTVSVLGTQVTIFFGLRKYIFDSIRGYLTVTDGGALDELGLGIMLLDERILWAVYE
jgi:hypothetical protein